MEISREKEEVPRCLRLLPKHRPSLKTKANRCVGRAGSCGEVNRKSEGKEGDSADADFSWYLIPIRGSESPVISPFSLSWFGEETLLRTEISSISLTKG